MFQDANLHLDLSIIPRAPGDNYRCANLHIGNQLRAGRRHLNESQRAVIAARLANMNWGGDRKSEEIKGPIGTLISLEQAADLLNVGRAVIAAKLANVTEGRPKTVPIGTVIIPTAQETTQNAPQGPFCPCRVILYVQP